MRGEWRMTDSGTTCWFGWVGRLCIELGPSNCHTYVGNHLLCVWTGTGTGGVNVVAIQEAKRILILVGLLRNTFLVIIILVEQPGASRSTKSSLPFLVIIHRLPHCAILRVVSLTPSLDINLQSISTFWGLLWVWTIYLVHRVPSHLSPLATCVMIPIWCVP